MIIISAILFFCLNAAVKSDTVNVSVDFNKETGTLLRPELYNNNSLLRTPSDAIVEKYTREIGIAEMMRCWVTIDDYWNPETNEYNFNFPCGWDLNKWDRFYNYMDRFSRTSNEILFNVRGLHKEVAEGKISMQKWREACKAGIKHYKQLYPRIKYIEALNEYELKTFGALTNEQYYQFYKEFYKIVNEVNNELRPVTPLLIGGPCITNGSLINGLKKDNMRYFLKAYANDKDPDKRLDFISYHEYRSAHDPSLIAQHEGLIHSWCKEFGLSENIPVFLNEMGDNSAERFNNTPIQNNQLLQAALMASYFYYLKDLRYTKGFHWVIQHKNQDRKNQIYDNLRWSPYGMSLKMQSRMAPVEVEVDYPGPSAGKGVYCIASKGENKYTVMVWNYQWEHGKDSSTVNLDFRGIPEMKGSRNYILKEYLLDLTHNNIHTAYPLLSDTHHAAEQLRESKVEEISNNNKISCTVRLAPNAMCLIEITQEK